MTLGQTFRFEKWYFDLAVPTGEVIFFFIAQTRILGWRDARLSLTVTSPRMRAVHRSLLLKGSELPALPPFGVPPDGEIPIRIRGQGLSLDLAFRPYLEDRPVARPMTMPRGPKRILWEPVHTRSLVRGEIQVGGKIWKVAGADGYIDRLSSDVFPLFTPVRLLYWGRLHHREGSLVYAVVRGACPQALTIWDSRQGRLEFDAVDVLERGQATSPILGLRYPRAYTLTAGGLPARMRLDVEHVVPAVEVAFVGNEKPRAFEGWAVDLIGRRPRSVKFFSRGRALIEDGGRTVTIETADLFSEIVRFS